jgi:hypothetical protein
MSAKALPPEVAAYLSAQGKRGGEVTSEAKATAARENGKKGGRPKMDAEHYITVGHVRGECGHKHKTADAAMACLMRDRRVCATQGGYSDRAVWVVRGDAASYVGGDEDA